ncbi:hypothetical protein HYV82_05500 [Candidatus Woesearchaeota archaeon]|nr:hypothetical protein [Candidatus Woesearchaeota archaeon]
MTNTPPSVAEVQTPAVVYDAILSDHVGGNMFPIPVSSLDGLLREAGMGDGSNVVITVEATDGQLPVSFPGVVSCVTYKPERPLDVGFRDEWPEKELRAADYRPGQSVTVSLNRV